MRTQPGCDEAVHVKLPLDHVAVPRKSVAVTVKVHAPPSSGAKRMSQSDPSQKPFTFHVPLGPVNTTERSSPPLAGSGS